MGAKWVMWRLDKYFNLAVFVILIWTMSTLGLIIWGSGKAAMFFQRSQQREVTAHLAFEINDFIVRHYDRAAVHLAMSPEIIRRIASPHLHNDAEQLLDMVRNTLSARFVFVLDAAGTMVAGSRITPGGENIAKDHSSMSYFHSAIQGKSGQYGLLSEDGERGFYFSEPVMAGERGPIGAVVVKMGCETVDLIFSAMADPIEGMLLTPEGVVFAAGNKERLFRRAPDHIVDQELINLRGDSYLAELYPLHLKGWTVATMGRLKYPYWIVGPLCGVIVLFAGAAITILFYRRREQLLSREVNLGKIQSFRAEKERLDTLRELRTILEASLVGIGLVKKGCLVNVNQRMATILGYRREELIGRKISELFTSRKLFRTFVKEYARQLTERNLEHIEYSLKKKDGRVIECALSGKALDASALSRGIVWVLEDITERKKVARELERVKEEAINANRAKSLFMANMSHELRTPMNGILGLSELFSHVELSEKEAGYIRMIRSSANRLMVIIDQLLDFSKIGAGRMVKNEGPFSPRASLEADIALLSVQAEKKNIGLSLNMDPKIPSELIGDHVKLSQVIVNLTANALKFTAEGSVEVRVSIREKSGDGDVKLLFEIVDTGIGIAREKQEMVFDAFVQGDSSHSRSYSGVGLGLPISRDLVRLLGGEINLESEEGKGTRFWFVLPFKVASTREAEPETVLSVDTDSFVGARILLAEDEPINRTLAVIVLEEAGYEVVSVHDGKVAIDCWTRENFDCILMDLQMPRMDGYQAVRVIREREREMGRRTPIVAMTAHALREDRDKCLDCGMDDYLAKPFDREQLVKIIGKAMADNKQSWPTV